VAKLPKRATEILVVVDLAIENDLKLIRQVRHRLAPGGG
jgi:hypothetical protein